VLTDAPSSEELPVPSNSGIPKKYLFPIIKAAIMRTVKQIINNRILFEIKYLVPITKHK
jgi:hypothetical protein